MPKRRFFRVTIFFLLFFLFMLTSIQLNFTLLLNNQIKNHIIKEILRQTHGEYQIQINKLSVDLFTRSIKLTGVEMESTDIIKPNTPKIFISIGEISLLRFNLLPLLLKKQLIIRKIELKNSSGYLFRSESENQKRFAKKFSFYRVIRKYLNTLEIKNANIINADIRIFNNRNVHHPFLVSRNNRLKLFNLRISQSIEESGKLFYADSLKLEINNIQYKSNDHLYTAVIKKFTASYTDSRISFDSVRIFPNLSKTAFQERMRHQTDWISVSATHLIFNRMWVKMFFENNRFTARSLTVYDLRVLAYRDKNLPPNKRSGKSVQQLIRSIPVSTAIDTIRLKNARITYQEVPEGSKKAGELFFNEIHGTITGLNNFHSSALEIKAFCKIMNQGNFRVHYHFPLNTDKMVFDCIGRLDDFPLKTLNPVLENNARFLIKDGITDSLIFSFHADEKAASGQMKFVYHGLKIELLSKNMKSGIIQDLLSMLAHKFFLKENNPSGKKPVRITRIQYTRDPSRFFLNYSWKSLLSGIKPAIGLKGSKHEDV